MNRQLRRVLPSLLTLAALRREHRADSPAPKKVASVEGIAEYRLENGLRVLLFPIRPAPRSRSI